MYYISIKIVNSNLDNGIIFQFSFWKTKYRIEMSYSTKKKYTNSIASKFTCFLLVHIYVYMYIEKRWVFSWNARSVTYSRLVYPTIVKQSRSSAEFRMICCLLV